jgi:hypothetical protein
VRKKYKKFLMPLLIAYKLKFFTLVPVFIGKALLYLKVVKLKLLTRLATGILFFLIQLEQRLARTMPRPPGRPVKGSLRRPVSRFKKRLKKRPVLMVKKRPVLMVKKRPK